MARFNYKKTLGTRLSAHQLPLKAHSSSARIYTAALPTPYIVAVGIVGHA